jgi:serine/threonine protein kinase
MAKPNDRIGPYVLIEKIGRGAFGVVWLAEKQTVLTKTRVALKLPDEEEVDLDAVRQEASLWVQASGHPNVLPIIDADVYGEQVVIVSEYAPDGSLTKWLSAHGGKAPSFEAAVDMTLGILSGLDHLHRRGIIHRDLKPDNILLQNETPRLADFGIARILKTTSKSTVVSGTPYYMPPEAFDAKRSERTDIWSVGVMLYQLLTGALPFPQTDITSLIAAIITKDPAPPPASLPPRLNAVLERALQKNPELRYKTAGEMRRDLREALQQLSRSGAETIRVVVDSVAPERPFSPSEGEPEPSSPPRRILVSRLQERDQLLTANEEASPTRRIGPESSGNYARPSESSNFGDRRSPQRAAPRAQKPRRLLVIGGAVALSLVGLVLAFILVAKFFFPETFSVATGGLNSTEGNNHPQVDAPAAVAADAAASPTDPNGVSAPVEEVESVSVSEDSVRQKARPGDGDSLEISFVVENPPDELSVTVEGHPTKVVGDRKGDGNSRHISVAADLKNEVAAIKGGKTEVAPLLVSVSDPGNPPNRYVFEIPVDTRIFATERPGASTAPALSKAEAEEGVKTTMTVKDRATSRIKQPKRPGAANPPRTRPEPRPASPTVPTRPATGVTTVQKPPCSSIQKKEDRDNARMNGRCR